ncbi:site-specific integrase [Bacillus solitudinis]|uniref:site-specific integrase n=1 Tax=Bacillus solitudinis TaxID=2014074 RepID=UPI000C2309CC|nr:tyrosine-type recombinase/integrase [Bacillus solitudinis]
MQGYFRKRGDKWSFTIDIGRDPATGNRKQKSKSGFKTKKEAQAAAAELLNQLNKGISFDNENVIIEDFMKHWLDSVAKHRVKPRTFLNYTRAMERRILPTFGKLKLKDLRLHHGQKAINDMLEEGRSPRYIEYTFILFKAAINYAIDSDLLYKNPFRQLEIPKPRRQKMTTWTSEEMKRFITFAKQDNPFYFIPLLIAMHTGMRRGEFLGLSWKDVDMDRKKISVNQAIVYDEPTNKFTFTDLKTKSSYRQITISDDLINELKRHQLRQKEMKLMHGAAYEDWGLVCPRENGKPIFGRQLAWYMDKVTKIAGLQKIRIHDIRHSHATLLLRKGENPKIVSERLGHSTVKMTLDVYSHVTEDMQENAAKKVSDALSF